jgi:hypothetical protein
MYRTVRIKLKMFRLVTRTTEDGYGGVKYEEEDGLCYILKTVEDEVRLTMVVPRSQGR